MLNYAQNMRKFKKKSYLEDLLEPLKLSNIPEDFIDKRAFPTGIPLIGL